MSSTRKCAVFMMACAIAAGLTLSSTAWADALAQVQYAMALGTTGTNQVNIAPTYTVTGQVVPGSGASIDFGSNAAGSTFGGLVVTESNFNFLAPNGGTGNAENGGLPVSQGGTNPIAVGFQAIQDAVNAGGQSGASFGGNPSNYPTSPTNVGFVSTAAGSNSTGVMVVAAVDNALGAPGTGTQLYTTWRGIDMTNMGDVALISPTWVGDANMDGTVDTNDAALWAYGSTPGSGVSGWFYGDWNNDGTIDANDIALWAYTSTPGVVYPLPFNPNAPGGMGPSSNAVAVPEPATIWLAGTGALCLLGLRLRRKVVARNV